MATSTVEAKRLPDMFSSVSLEPVLYNDLDTGKMHVILDDPTFGKTPVSMVSKNYAIWSNYEATKVVEEIMHRSPYQFGPVHNIWNGKQLSMFWKTTENIIDLPEVGDAINLGIRLDNSYDGTSKLRIAIMAYVLKCTNGMVSDRNWGVFSVRHDNSRVIDWTDAAFQLEHGAGKVISFAPQFKQMTEKKFDMSSMLNLAADSGINASFLGKYVKALADEKKDNFTQWEAMNVGTALMNNPDSFTGVRQLEALTNVFLENVKN